MKYKRDENLGPGISPMFSDKGLDCQTVHGEGITGADDDAVLAAAVAEGRILVTMDHDFGNVPSFPPESTCGVAILNLPGSASRRLLATLMQSFVDAREQGALKGKLWIVEPGRIRERQSSEAGSE
jgi:predicted nuclease of predicted toxin-antitoxin system